MYEGYREPILHGICDVFASEKINFFRDCCASDLAVNDGHGDRAGCRPVTYLGLERRCRE